jgi:MHS family proline/betaine transporter-like MFS transporter
MKNAPLASVIGAPAEIIRISPKAVIAAALGNSFEWYDFTVYALFSIYIAEAFFPGGGSTLELVKALLAFGLGFVARPLGAVVFGLYGDRFGRRAVLNLALLIMFVGTAVLAFAPTPMAA